MTSLLHASLALALSVSVALGMGACSDDDVPHGDGPFDMKASEAISPPDWGVSDSFTGGVGRPCDFQGVNRCGGQAICIDLGRGVGACAIPDCTLEDLKTAAKEDNCPEGTSCGAISWPIGGGGGTRRNFCFVDCTVSATENSCRAVHPDLACDPSTILFTGHSEVCATPACRQAGDCGTGNPLDPKATCDTVTGLCFVKGEAGASVGDPCKVSTDCGEDQFCYTGGGSLQNTVVGGYCTKLGCSHGGRWSCPPGSGCFQLGSAHSVSICLATGCDLTAELQEDGCRDEDTSGAYDCLKSGTQAVCWVPER
ncbi:MAG: hypothetical protein KAI47_12435 [Deltaproteobacteria bacterium]|nr:hypothetical protein [Deltaproteobacteria bacterium]